MFRSQLIVDDALMHAVGITTVSRGFGQLAGKVVCEIRVAYNEWSSSIYEP